MSSKRKLSHLDQKILAASHNHELLESLKTVKEGLDHIEALITSSKGGELSKTRQNMISKISKQSAFIIEKIYIS